MTYSSARNTVVNYVESDYSIKLDKRVIYYYMNLFSII